MYRDSSPSTDVKAIEERDCKVILCCDGAVIALAGEREAKEFYRGVGMAAKTALAIAALVCIYLLR